MFVYNHTSAVTWAETCASPCIWPMIWAVLQPAGFMLFGFGPVIILTVFSNPHPKDRWYKRNRSPVHAARAQAGECDTCCHKADDDLVGQLVSLAMDVKVILTQPCIFH